MYIKKFENEDYIIEENSKTPRCRITDIKTGEKTYQNMTFKTCKTWLLNEWNWTVKVYNLQDHMLSVKA